MSQSGRYFTSSGPGAIVQTLTSNIGGPVPPTGGNINVIGGANITGTGNPGTSTITFNVTGTTNHSVQIGNVSGSLSSVPNGTTGEVLLANTGSDPNWGSVASAGAVTSVTGGSNINITGTATAPVVNLDNTVSILGSMTAGTGLTTTTGDVTITAGNLTLPNTNGAGTQGEITFGGGRFISNFGGTNTFVGGSSGNTTLTGFSNFAGGAQALQSLTSGAFNSAVGFLAGGVLTSGGNNVAVGSGSLSSATTTSQNTAIGSSALNTATAPVNNISIGYFAGSAYTTNESNNITIGNIGVIADSARIRIGTNGTQTSTFIVGIDGVNVGSTAKVVTMGTAGTVNQLGTATITAGTGITVTPGANSITISSTGTTTLTYTNVNTTPYVVLATDEYLSVDCSGGVITIQLPNAATLGRTFIIKDRTGSANSNTITVTTVGGAVNIDGATSYSMNTQYAAIELIGNGSTYEIF